MHVFFCLTCPIFFFKITRPSNNFEFSKLPVANPEHDFFRGNFVFVRLQIKLFSRIILVIILANMVTSENWSSEAGVQFVRMSRNSVVCAICNTRKKREFSPKQHESAHPSIRETHATSGSTIGLDCWQARLFGGPQCHANRHILPSSVLQGDLRRGATLPRKTATDAEPKTTVPLEDFETQAHVFSPRAVERIWRQDAHGLRSSLLRAGRRARHCRSRSRDRKRGLSWRSCCVR